MSIEQRRKAILVTGSRDWRDDYAIGMALVDAGAGYGPQQVTLIHGDCGGADRLAGAFARSVFWTELPMPAPWALHGKPAGPRRNKRMLEVLQALAFCEYDCDVHAFPLPQSKGTRHMMAIAKAAGFKVHDHGKR